MRLAKGLTQTELGQAVGVGKSAICQYESETRAPDAAVLVRLAGFLGATTDWLLGRDTRGDHLAREPRPVYGPDAGDASGWHEYLTELHAQLAAIQSAADRHAILEMARFLAQKSAETQPRTEKRRPRESDPPQRR